MWIKFSSLINHYNKKDIDRAESIHMDSLKGVEWVIGEKLDGANISLLFLPFYPTRYFSRNQEITGDNFYNSGELFKETIEKMSNIQKFVDKTRNTIRLYGELFGPGIQKGVNYGNEKRILFFDMMENDNMVSQMKFENFMYDIGLGYMTIPKEAIVPSLAEALEFESGFDSKILGKENNICEGIVIKPWNKILIDSTDSLFYIKKKNPEFSEKQEKKIKKEANWSDEVNQWRETFLNYIHQNRIDSVFSKEGPLETIKDLGKYIKFVMEDTLETFHKEEEFPDTFTKNEKKFILNGGSEISSLLKNSLR